MTTSYRIIRYSAAYKPAVLELQTHLWHRDPEVNRAYLEWKYTRNPFDRDHLIYLAFDGDKAIGMRGIFGSRWHAGNSADSFSMPVACDTVVDPEYRRRGVLKAIMRFLHDDLRESGEKFVINMSASEITFLTSLKLGWQSPGPNQIMRRSIPGGEPAGQAGDECLVSLPLGRLNNYAEISLSSTPRPTEMERLAERTQCERIQHVRDCQYFSWRFENPLSHYRTLFFDDGELDGFLVLQAPRYQSGNVIKIIDWEGATIEIKQTLLRAAVELCAHQDMNIWRATLPSAECRAVEEAGFECVDAAQGAAPYNPGLLLKALDGTPPESGWNFRGFDLLDMDSWQIRQLFSEGC